MKRSTYVYQIDLFILKLLLWFVLFITVVRFTYLSYSTLYYESVILFQLHKSQLYLYPIIIFVSAVV